jgi:hypothetical protein
MCPHHGFEKWRLLHTFYEGLTNNTRMTIYAATGGSLMKRRIGDAYNLIEKIALNQVQWSTERGPIRAQVFDRFEIDQITKLQVMVEAFHTKNRQIRTEIRQNMKQDSTNISFVEHFFPCTICGCTHHLTVNCTYQQMEEGSVEQANMLTQQL